MHVHAVHVCKPLLCCRQSGYIFLGNGILNVLANSMTFDFCLASVSDVAQVLISWIVKNLERDVTNET